MNISLTLLFLSLALGAVAWQEPCLAASGTGSKLAQAKTPAAGKAQATAKTAKDDSKGDSQEEKPELTLTSPELAAAAQNFRAAPNEGNWDQAFQALRALLSKPAAAHADPQTILKLNPCLNELGAKVIAAGGARVWSFPKVEQCQHLLVQWSESKSQTVGTGRRKKVVTTTASRLEPLTPPQGVILKDARLLDIASAAEKAAKPERARFLICAGSKRGGNGMWLASYKFAAGGWHENNEPLSAIPPFLVSNISGLIGFSGSDLVVTVTPSKDAVAQPPKGGARLPEPQSSHYKLVLRLQGGKFALEGSANDDTPYNAVYQFVRAVEQGRTDLAKAWLIDPSLISIPKYVGLSTRTPETPPRIINMSSTTPGSYRYRLVTFDRYDLICDVAKYKQQWAVKAVFVAGADPLLQKIARSLQPPEQKPLAPPAEPGKNGDGKGKDEEKVPTHKPKN